MVTETKLYNESVLVTLDTGENGEKHDYRVDGNRKAGVTTYTGILDKSNSLIPWAVGLALDYVRGNKEVLGLDADEIYARAQAEAERVKNEAADLGTKIHNWIEDYIKGQLPEMPEDKNVLQGITSFLEWKDKHNVKFLSSERIVYSKKYDYIGKMDAEAEVDGKLCVVDFKTGNNIYSEVKLQTAAYLMADKEESGRKYDGRWVVRISKETEDEYVVRMTEKNSKRVARGLKPVKIDEFKLFEAIYLDPDKKSLKIDFKAFTSILAIYRWKLDAEKCLRNLKNGK